MFRVLLLSYFLQVLPHAGRKQVTSGSVEPAYLGKGSGNPVIEECPQLRR